MPLVLVTGLPCSGKTRMASLLASQLSDSVLVSEHEIMANLGLGTKDEVCRSAEKEKTLRSRIRSEVSASLDKRRVVIVDAANDVKGFRYELYCVAKAANSTQALVHCDISSQYAKEINGRLNHYQSETFDALVMRYEEPSAQNRWDSPLFVVPVTPDDCGQVDVDELRTALFQTRPLKPNFATQSQPLAPDQLLSSLDASLREVSKALLDAQANEEDRVIVQGQTIAWQSDKRWTAGDLARARRQFVVYAKSRGIENVTNVPSMFVDFLASS